MSDTALYIFGVVDGAALLFLTVYFIINLSDLECDYINATTCCRRLNVWILPEMVAHGVITALLLVHFQWTFFILNAPLSGLLIYRFKNKPPGNVGLYDPAEIYNRHELRWFLKEAMVKLGFHVVFFFLYLYSMISSLVASNEVRKAKS
ncbi:protein cornichon homolog 4-like [Acropora palmata]|uniref:protein cornichon homolog 4-like n=1 Tax=Acropora palmata TaxID=6131 RepID=UPI003DA05DF0